MICLTTKITLYPLYTVLFLLFDTLLNAFSCQHMNFIIQTRRHPLNKFLRQPSIKKGHLIFYVILNIPLSLCDIIHVEISPYIMSPCIHVLILTYCQHRINIIFQNVFRHATCGKEFILYIYIYIQNINNEQGIHVPIDLSIYFLLIQ